jgi:hypothetical protein
LCLCGIAAVRTRKGTASYHTFGSSKCTNAPAQANLRRELAGWTSVANSG